MEFFVNFNVSLFLINNDTPGFWWFNARSFGEVLHLRLNAEPIIIPPPTTLNVKINNMLNILLYAIASLIWGSTWFGIKLQLTQVPPILSIAYRFCLV